VDLAMKIAMVYWKHKGINQRINSSSFDGNNDEIRQVSILVNGGKPSLSVVYNYAWLNSGLTTAQNTSFQSELEF